MDGHDNRKSSGLALCTNPLADCQRIAGLGDVEQLKFKTTGVLVHGTDEMFVFNARQHPNYSRCKNKSKTWTAGCFTVESSWHSSPGPQEMSVLLQELAVLLKAMSVL